MFPESHSNQGPQSGDLSITLEWMPPSDGGIGPRKRDPQNRHSFSSRHTHPEPRASHRSLKETIIYLAGFSPWKILRLPKRQCKGFFGKTSLKNRRNRPVGHQPKRAIRRRYGAGWVDPGVQPSTKV